ncbi:MAG: hypothetical protein F6J93_32560 [Oscillatoria sp. SIO1A7]|nr:hypothetical protein [Oscillatoria sp. SIO1A7]
MKKVIQNRWLVRWLGVAAIALLSYCPPVTAQSDRPGSPQENRSFQLAQRNANLCRIVRAPDGLVARERPDPSAPARGRLELNDRVTLIQDHREIKGPDGRTWIEIKSPVRGFISNGYPRTPSNLKNCEESTSQNPNPNPNSNPSLCRQANTLVAPEGLVVRADASSSSARRGGISPGERVTLIPNYQRIPDKNGQDRRWVEIISPISGFVSANSLIRCPEAIPQRTETTSPRTGSLCRQVTPNLTSREAQVRADASVFSTYRGGIEPGGEVTLVPNYELIRDKSGEPRDWVELISPINGFIRADLLMNCP